MVFPYSLLSTNGTHFLPSFEAQGQYILFLNSKVIHPFLLSLKVFVNIILVVVRYFITGIYPNSLQTPYC